MRIRPYIESKDYESLAKWIDDEKIHALWCASLIPYPITKENLHSFLEKSAIDWTDSAYVATESDGRIIGFFCYSINVDENAFPYKDGLWSRCHMVIRKGNGK